MTKGWWNHHFRPERVIKKKQTLWDLWQFWSFSHPPKLTFHERQTNSGGFPCPKPPHLVLNHDKLVTIISDYQTRIEEFIPKNYHEGVTLFFSKRPTFWCIQFLNFPGYESMELNHLWRSKLLWHSNFSQTSGLWQWTHVPVTGRSAVFNKEHLWPWRVWKVVNSKMTEKINMQTLPVASMYGIMVYLPTFTVKN